MSRFRVVLFLVLVTAVWGVLLAAGLLGGETAVAAPSTIPVTTITVNSGTDPDTSDSRTCLTYTPCTLRRAIIQARNLPANEKPVLIAFDIPATAGEGYDSTLQVW